MLYYTKKSLLESVQIFSMLYHLVLILVGNSYIKILGQEGQMLFFKLLF